MKRVIIESPYAGDIERNTIYLRRAIKDCLDRGEAPFASHRMYTDAYDDDVPVERQRGIEAGYAWWNVADEILFYNDYGMSNGMNRALQLCNDKGRSFTVRYIGKNP